MSPKRSSLKSQEREATFVRLCLFIRYHDTAGRLAGYWGARIKFKFNWTWVQIMNLLLTQELSFLFSRIIKFQATQGYTARSCLKRREGEGKGKGRERNGGKKKSILVIHSCNPSPRELRQEDCEFRTNLGYIVR